MAIYAPPLEPTLEAEVFDIYRQAIPVAQQAEQRQSESFRAHDLSEEALKASLLPYVAQNIGVVLASAELQLQTSPKPDSSVFADDPLDEEADNTEVEWLIANVERPADIMATEPNYRADRLQYMLMNQTVKRHKATDVNSEKSRARELRQAFNRRVLGSEHRLLKRIDWLVRRNLGSLVTSGRWLEHLDAGDGAFDVPLLGADKDQKLPGDIAEAERHYTEAECEWMFWRRVAANCQHQPQKEAQAKLKGTRLRFTLMDFLSESLGIYGYHLKKRDANVFSYREIPKTVEGRFFATDHKGQIVIVNRTSPTGYYAIKAMNTETNPPTPNVNMVVLDKGRS